MSNSQKNLYFFSSFRNVSTEKSLFFNSLLLLLVFLLALSSLLCVRDATVRAVCVDVANNPALFLMKLPNLPYGREKRTTPVRALLFVLQNHEVRCLYYP